MSRMPLSSFGWLAALAVSAVLYASALVPRPIHTHGEAREALVVKNMLEQREYVLPLRNGAEIPSKPPLFHWTAALFSMASGAVTEVTVRAPSVLYASAALAVIFLLGARPPSAADTAAVLMVATAFEWMRSAGHARVDMCFAFWSIVSVVAVYRAASPPGASPTRIGWLVCAAAAGMMAVLTKGPAGLVLPALIGALFVAARRLAAPADEKPLPLLPFAASAGAAVCGAAVWYLAAYERAGEPFLEIHLWREHLGRIVSIDGIVSGHHKPFYHSFLYLLVGLFPWSAYLPVAAAALWAGRRSAPRRPLLLLCLLWAGAFLAVITVSSSKRMVYFLPSFPAYAYLLAQGIALAEDRARSEAKWARAAAAFLLALAAATAAAALLVAGSAPDWLLGVLPAIKERDRDSVLLVATLLSSSPILALFCWSAAALLSATAALVFRNRLLLSVRTAAGAMIAAMLAVNMFFLPALAELKSPRQFILDALERAPAECRFAQLKVNLYPVLFYLPGNAPVVRPALAQSDAPLCLIAREGDAAVLPPGRFEVLLESTAPVDGRHRLKLLYYRPS